MKRLLALLCVLACLFMLCMPVLAADDAEAEGETAESQTSSSTVVTEVAEEEDSSGKVVLILAGVLVDIIGCAVLLSVPRKK